ncbi:MAG: hypothetical protein AMS22_00050 [Thiotrichales bacterium SG8_50]|nr:MAG: hypothetical protein AMS22_00050 [Thiotrichales bacterium SG8_50]
MRSLIKHVFLFALYGVIFSVAGAVTLFIYQLQDRPDLRPWHEARIDEEFTASRKETIRSFADYLALEQRVFAQVQSRVYDRVEERDRRLLTRYHQGSLSDPQVQERDWNRSFEWPAKDPRGGVLLLHGLSDSPYSMRTLAEQFQRMGFWVVGIRLPGHGTAPSGLVNVTWQDFGAATEMAAGHVRKQVDADKPFYIVGYSTGAALAVEYSLSVLLGKDNPMPAGLILLSPSIGVTPLAKFAVWQSRLSMLPGLEKLAWESIGPEFDPFKYKSFAVNAGDQIYQLTEAIGEHIERLDRGNGVTDFPRVLAFQSVVDATVATPALISGLFDRLAPEGHELVLFDINRYAEVEPVLVSNPAATTRGLLENRSLPFTLTVVTNVSKESNALTARQKQAQSAIVTDTPLTMSWPENVFSLSHVALPFPPDDPLYGAHADPTHPGIHLGRIDVLGERGLLLFPADEVIRLRYNPFYSYIEQRVGQFVASPH